MSKEHRWKKPAFAGRFLPSTLVACFVSTAAITHAAGGGAYRLDWPHPGEVLSYRSCGCADACWVAEVRHQRTKALNARLRCDCETLHFAQSANPSKETVLGSCEAIRRDGSKPQAIRQTLEQLLHPAAGGPVAPQGAGSSAP
ncbi:hypothetical protein [Acidovorax sp. SUPP3334]|uniref:hypothetical protein n=1 Tax=Acidovorax sp. SUPP3334 TaxID=2920881 RepID=UPI0023DE40DF|nr:hypothetical protein [Acidovorax sp. SUPP3334]GKT22667.1 hypothetical protein AVHM3334_09150 [Acidovorax sp. SUPP3334]